MKKFFILFILIAFFLLSGTGCKRRYYDLITYNSPTQIISEVVVDTQKITNFVGTDISLMKGRYNGERIFILRTNYANAVTKDHGFINIGGTVYGGFYKVSGLGPYEEENYTSTNYNGNYFGLGATANLKMGLNLKFSNFKLGIGVDLYGGLEGGEYLSFRKDAKSKGVIWGSDDPITAMINGFIFSSYRFLPSSLVNLQINLGTPGYFSPILTYQHRDNVYHLSYMPEVERVNLGFMVSLTKIF